MGKLRFTLTNVIFWIVLVLSCLLSESVFSFNIDPIKSFSSDQSFIITIAIIGMLGLYYFLEHKKNGLKFDKILLPSFCIAGLLLVLNILRQTNRSFLSYSGDWDFIMPFTNRDRIMASLQVVIWLGVTYALVFVYNRFRLNKESFRWLPKIYLIGTLFMCLIDHFLEAEVIFGILDGTYEGEGLVFFMGNPNVWSLLIFSGFLSALLLCYKRFRWYYYVAMVYLFIFNIITTCATTVYIMFFALLAYSLFEIINHYKVNKNFSRKLLFIYLGSVIGSISLVAILTATRVPLFYNVWSFLCKELFAKDFATFSGRTDMWGRMFITMSRNPSDLILGLGHQTGSLVFQEYMGHTVKSAHNAFLEIFLRYGIIGLLVYLGVIGLTIYCFVRHIKEKNYRFAFIYGVCFLSIMIHSLTESTTLFTPNIGGLYFSFIFVLPVLNIIQRKHFKELKDDLMTVNGTKETIQQRSVFTSLIVIAFSFTLTTILKLAFNMGVFRTILVLLVVLVLASIAAYFLRKDKQYDALKIIANNSLLSYKELVSKEKDNE